MWPHVNVQTKVCSNFPGHITKTRLYSFDPLEPHFYTVKLAEAFLTSTHNLCFEQKYEKYQNFNLKIVIF